MVNCWPACAVAGQPSVACAAPLSAGRPPTAMPSVRTTPKVVTRARMFRPPSVLVQPNPRAMARSSRASKRGAGEGAADEPHIALRHPEGVADVAGAVAVHVAHLGVGELATLPQPHIELGYNERIPDIDDPIPVHVAAPYRVELIGADRAVRGAGTGTDNPALVEIVYGRRRTDGL